MVRQSICGSGLELINMNSVFFYMLVLQLLRCAIIADKNYCFTKRKNSRLQIKRDFLQSRQKQVNSFILLYARRGNLSGTVQEIATVVPPSQRMNGSGRKHLFKYTMECFLHRHCHPFPFVRAPSAAISYLQCWRLLSCPTIDRAANSQKILE